MNKIFFILLILILNLSSFSYSYEYTKILDIGNSLKSYNNNIFVTEIGFFDNDNSFIPIKVLDRNIKCVDKSDSLFAVLYEDNFFEIYRIDSLPSVVYSESLNYYVEKFFISNDYFLFKTGSLYFLYKYENNSLIRINHFNLNSIDNFFSYNNHLLFITNDGEIIKYGKVEGFSFFFKNHLFVNNSKFLFYNKYSTIISNSKDKYLYFFVFRDDSLKLLYEVPDNRVYYNGFSIDSFLILFSSDSIFIRTVIDSFITYSIDSFEFKDRVKDIVFYNDTFYINTGYKIVKYSLISKSFKESAVFSKSFQGFVRTNLKNGFYSDDSFFIFLKDSIVEARSKSKTLFKNSNILLCYDEIIIPQNDSFKFFPISSYINITKSTNDGVYFIDNTGMFKKLNLINDSIVTLFETVFNSNDFEKHNSYFYFVSGQNGILKFNETGQLIKSYFDGSYFQRIFTFKNRLFTLKDNHKISIIDYENLIENESFLVNDYIDFYNYSDTLSVFLTKDSIIFYTDYFEKVNLEDKILKNIKDVVFDDQGSYILLKNGALLFFKKQITNLKEDDKKQNDENIAFKTKELYYDILGRKIYNSLRYKGLYFIKKGKSIKKMFNLK